MNSEGTTWLVEPGFRLILENSLFFLISLGFLVWTGWAWRQAKPFDLPTPLPSWFKYWFGSVQVVGVVPPLVALSWSLWRGYTTTTSVFLAYFIMLALQVIAELLSLRRFRSVVWVMVPYLYVPYRLWQLYEGLTLTRTEVNLLWLQGLLIVELIVWSLNYLLDLAQLPRLLQWPEATNS